VSSNPAYRSLTQALAPELLFAPRDHEALAPIVTDTETHASAANVRKLILDKYDISTLAKNIIITY
jgi:hypothetical protein